MKGISFSIFLSLSLFLFSAICTAEISQEIPRKIIAFYDSEHEGTQVFSPAHQLAEMPLNHLGLVLEYHDFRKSLPDLSNRPEVVGVLHWLWPGTLMADPLAFIAWSTRALNLGKKYVLIGDPGFFQNQNAKPLDINIRNQFLVLLGLKDTDSYIDITYDSKFVILDPIMLEYEGLIDVYKPAYQSFKAISAKVQKVLVVRQQNDRSSDSVLAAICPQGAYVAPGYAVFWDSSRKPALRNWIINPWEFFRAAFQTDNIPKPDTNTIAGRRIFYSHIDGDGWNSLSQIEKYRKKPTIAAETIYNEVISKYADLPVTVTAIAADLDPAWAAERDSQKIARQLFTLPHVEIGSHTYSHPFFWEFFRRYSPEKERFFLKRYLGKKWDASVFERFTPFSWLKQKTGLQEKGAQDENLLLPRGYGAEQFNLDKEITGSLDYLKKFAPPGKNIPILMWSGDTSPYEEVLAKTREAGLLNINGGETRYDREYPSYAWVSSIGMQIGNEQQIYSSNSNENTYTDLWRDRFFGFQFLKRTIYNTETPIRIKPMNIYYHMYSGEKIASLNALLQNLDYARALKDQIAPIQTSHYAQIADGFYKSKFFKLGDDSWRIENRGRLATIRFDNAFEKAVDFTRSAGVIGQRHLHGSLYVYLDDAAEKPVITLQKYAAFDELASSLTPYLIDSRWVVSDLKFNPWQFNTQGYGDLNMRWWVPKNGQYQVSLSRDGAIFYNAKMSALNNELLLKFKQSNFEKTSVNIEWVGP